MKSYSPPFFMHLFRSPVPALIYGALALASITLASSPSLFVFSILPLLAGTAFFVWILQRSKTTVHFALREYARSTVLRDVFIRQLTHDYGQRSAARKVGIAYAEAVNHFTYTLLAPYLSARGIQFGLYAILTLGECMVVATNPEFAEHNAVALGMLLTLPTVPELAVLHTLFRSHRSDMTKWVTDRLGLRHR